VYLRVVLPVEVAESREDLLVIRRMRLVPVSHRLRQRDPGGKPEEPFHGRHLVIGLLEPALAYADMQVRPREMGQPPLELRLVQAAPYDEGVPEPAIGRHADAVGVTLRAGLAPPRPPD